MRNAMLVIFMALLLVVSASGCESREHSIKRAQGYLKEHPPEDVPHYFKDVEYASAGGEKLTMDISHPEGRGPFPILIIIHGGGWTLHTNSIMQGTARYITNRGFAVFNINYRVLPEVTMQEIIEDAMGAVIWVKEHGAEYKGDVTRIALTGDSAGGHLTAMIVTSYNNPVFHPTYKGNGKTDASVNLGLPSYGVFDFNHPAFIGKEYLKVSEKDDPELYQLISPINHVRKDLVPQLVTCGNLDPLFPSNKTYVEKLTGIGAPVEFNIVEGQTHAFLDYYWTPVAHAAMDRMVEFMNQHFKK